MYASNQRGLWTSTALVAAAVAAGFILRRQQQRQRREEGVTANQERAVKCLKDPNASFGQEEKKESEDRGRPVTEISMRAGDASSDKLRILSQGVITIVHASVTGTCAKLAKELELNLKKLLSSEYQVQVGKPEDWDWWDEFLNDEDDEDTTEMPNNRLPKLILLLPTYTNGTWPPTAMILQTTFQELLTDWRIEKFPLKRKIHVGIFGMGSSEYGDQSMGKPAREAQMSLHKLGAKTIVRLAVGDDAVGDDLTFEKWSQDLVSQIQKVDGPNEKINKKKRQQRDNVSESTSKDSRDAYYQAQCSNKSSHADDSNLGDNNNFEDYASDEEEQEESAIADLEDMGDSVLAAAGTDNGPTAPREMITPSQAQALQKEGYKLIGTHSAVKLCRWTKHQLRGRGGCYKHTFYGITSYQCMEATPSLACANKCTFCWRHHKNPIGKEWKWKTDDPNYIVDQAVNTHVQMIREAKGIPGVRMDRWKEALTVRHCALSLVGEPIMYPRIDEFLSDLHRRKISTFLVTNGQHPQAIGGLRPITQLYVSVDAPTKETLIEIDRPLFSDAWDRLKQSLGSLKDKGQRTVARLTIVKGWNSDEIEGYAKLIALGRVSLVEVKGVTYCGKSDASNLNMTNTPWHHEVVALTTTLRDELEKLRHTDESLPQYELACEHKHSCSVLLARVDQFAYDDPLTGNRKWRTWINYDRFHELAARNAADPSFAFSVEDYTADTPAWALIGSEEEGFDPTDTRHRKKKKYPKYTKFDDKGIPTHDHENKELAFEERQRLVKLMEERKSEIGCGTTVTEMKDGAKEIQDASLMFRGLVITK